MNTRVKLQWCIMDLIIVGMVIFVTIATNKMELFEDLAHSGLVHNTAT